MERRQALEKRGAEPCQLHAHCPPILGVDPPCNEIGLLGTLDEIDDGVLADEKVISDLADRWPRSSSVSADHKQQLVLGCGQPNLGGLLFAPAQEPSQAVPESQQASVVGILKASARWWHSMIVYRSDLAS